jgi:hypothetical protein
MAILADFPNAKQRAEFRSFPIGGKRDKFCSAIYGIFLDTKYEILHSIKYEKNFHPKA